jgi:hypothetical protein
MPQTRAGAAWEVVELPLPEPVRPDRNGPAALMPTWLVAVANRQRSDLANGAAASSQKSPEAGVRLRPTPGLPERAPLCPLHRQLFGQ